MDNIRIEHQPNVPVKLITKFLEQIGTNNAIITNTKDLEHFHYAEGQLVADVSMWFSNHSSEVAVNLVSGAIQGTLGLGIAFLWRALKKVRESKPKSDTVPFILSIDGKEYEMRFILNDDLEDESAQNALKQLKNTLKDKQFVIYLHDTKFHQRGKQKPIIDFEYHPDTNLWLPINYSDLDAYFFDANERIKNWKD